MTFGDDAMIWLTDEELSAITDAAQPVAGLAACRAGVRRGRALDRVMKKAAQEEQTRGAASPKRTSEQSFGLAVLRPVVQVRRIKKLLLRLADQPMDQARADRGVFGKLSGERVEKRITILDRKRPGRVGDQGHLIVGQRDRHGKLW